MTVNPYESPLSMEPSEDIPHQLREKTHGATELLMVSGSVILLLAATLHRLQLDSPTYTSSSLIGIEIVALLAAFPVFVFGLFRSLYLATNGRWLAAVLNLFITFLTLVAVFVAMWIDAPTLVYAT